jgi:hypothetical protein
MRRNSSRQGTEHRLIMAALTGLCALAVVSSIVPIVEHIPGVALILIGLGCAGCLAIRRELRIRRRIAHIDGPRYAQRPGGASQSRVGPGDHAPVSSAPTRLTVVRLPGIDHPDASAGGAA